MDVSRPFLTLHVFGSGGCGKTTLKTQWFDSSHSRALSEIADVHIRIQKDCGYGVMDGIRDFAGLDGGRHQGFIILYRPDSKESIQYSQTVLNMIYTTFDYTSQINITFLENHFEKEFKPHTEEPTEFPMSPAQLSVLASRNPPQLWRVVVTDSVQVSAALDRIITQPLLEILNKEAKEDLMKIACTDGRLEVLKLLIGTVMDLDPMTLLGYTLASLEEKLLASPPSSFSSSSSSPFSSSSPSHPCSSKLTDSLLSVAYYLYYMDTDQVMGILVRCTPNYPRATLHLLREFSHQSQHQQHFLLSGVGLLSFPAKWVALTAFLTHIKVSKNLLTSIPDEVFQISTLQGLNLSHNCLESIPGVLKWNCPKLKELDVSYNRLVRRPYCILEGRRNREANLDTNLPSIGKQRDVISAAQALLTLTGYNLYPCLCSISRVNISHNPSLNQIPEWVCVLPSLTLLEMKGLPRLTHLSPHLSHCRSLCLLQLDTGHLISPPPDQAAKGTRNILTYLRCQLRGSTPYRHIKLVIVGEKGTGKTTLFRQFVKGNSKGGANSPNMDVAAFEYPSRIWVRKERPRVTFHVIDFAGDEVYRCTHNCFLTYRTIYLCLWNTNGGKESLVRLCPWLHSIQACVPGSPVILVATHIDRRPGLSANTILQWKEEVMGAPVQLKNKAIARGLGFPPIFQSVVMDCLNKDHVDKLLEDIYAISLEMRHPKTNVPLMSDMLPRSYQELQTLVEVKVRNLCQERRVPPVLRHEELIDYVRSLTISNPNGLEQDNEEFNLACDFLHEAGAIVHYKSQISGVSDLYFLDPQWLFNALAIVVKACSQGNRGRGSVSSGEWPHFFQCAGIPTSMYSPFLSMMESFNIIVSLDFEKNMFLVPSLLPETPPTNYPLYDLSSDLDNTTVQYVDLEYLPPPLFPQLIARVILYIRQLSGQLLSIAVSMEEEEGEEREDPGKYGSLDTKMREKFLSHAKSSPSFMKKSRSFYLDSLGYLTQDDIHLGGQDDMQRLRKIWGLSTANLSNCCTPSSRHKELTKKLVAISQPIFQRQAPSSLDNSSASSHSDQFASYVFWKKGLFCEFPCGTVFWLEACKSALTLVISGQLIHRVKVLSFLTSSIDALLDECYGGLKVVSYSPCPNCLQLFWASKSEGHLVNGEAGDDDELSPLNQSCEVQINEFSESILYLRRSPEDSTSPEHSLSFSGTEFEVSLSSKPEPGSTHFDEIPKVAVIGESLTLFPLATTVQQSVMSSTILCPHCKTRTPLEAISPHVLLVDFKNSLLLKAKHLEFTEDPSSILGKGGFGKVFRGTYLGESVAVKVFRKGYHEDVMLRRYKDLREELTIMSCLNHPRVVSLVGVCLRPLAMVLKMAPLGSLRNHIDLCPHGMQSQMAHQILYQIADGIRYLHTLYIVHRDIKPSNVLVWSLHPSQVVDVKLADYGVSQFYSPSGLRRHKGTEEYMAPELFHNKRKVTYDEKVDIFSFGLVLHVVVTGRRLFAGIMNKREQLHLLYNTDIPQLSAALADALGTSAPPPSTSTCKFPSFLEHGRHPAARLDVISSCHSVCMQSLMESCLTSNPLSRPSAQGLCSQLLVCPGATRQSDYYISAPVLAAVYSPTENLVVAIQRDRLDHVTLFPPDTWEIKRCASPYSGEKFCCLEVIGSEVFLGSSESFLLYSLGLPGLQSGHISSTPLPAVPSCLFSYDGRHGIRIVVGMAGSKIALFSTPPEGGHILKTQPKITQIVKHPDAGKISVLCGLYHERTIWCGCGRYLVGLYPDDLLMKHYIPIIQDDANTMLSMIAASQGHIWAGFKDKTSLVVCNSGKTNALETIDCLSILGKSKVRADKGVATVTDIVAGPSAVWVCTKGGHLLAFNPLTADVLLVHHKKCSITSMLCLSQKRLVTFGEGVVGGVEGEELDTTGMFAIWENYI